MRRTRNGTSARSIVLAASACLYGCGASDVELVSQDATPPTIETELEALKTSLAASGVPAPSLATQRIFDGGTVYRFDVDAENAVPTWEKVRSITDTIGFYPIVCQDESGTLLELEEFNTTAPSEVIRNASKLDATKWFGDRTAGDSDYYGSVERGEWQDSLPQEGWTVPFDLLDGTPHDNVWIALVPTTSPPEALAWLTYGDWNECPAAAVHVAVHRLWYETFGAEVVCVSGGTVEMRVARPPTDREGALALAQEQFVYSGGDLVFQGYETISALASALESARYWYFWWD